MSEPAPQPRTSAQIMDAFHARQRAEAEVEEVMPQPEQRATALDPARMPQGIKAIHRLCDEVYQLTWARGPVATTGGPSKWRQAISVVLKGGVGQRRFVAAWIEEPKGGMAFASAYAHGIGRVNATQLKAYLTHDILEDVEWLEGVGYVPLTRKGDKR